MKRATAASSLLVVLISCGGDQAADPLPVSAATTAPLVDSTHLVEVVTEAHFGAKVAASVRESTQTESFEGTLDKWTSGYGDGGELAPQAGRDGPTSAWCSCRPWDSTP